MSSVNPGFKITLALGALKQELQSGMMLKLKEESNESLGKPHETLRKQEAEAFVSIFCSSSSQLLHYAHAVTQA